MGEVHANYMHYYLQLALCEKKKLIGHFEHARHHLISLAHYRFPWMVGEADEVKSMLDKWKEFFGDPEDPEVQARIREQIDTLRRARRNAQLGRTVGNAADDKQRR